MIITFSGIDGSGKSFFSDKIAEILKDKGLNAEKVSPAYVTNDIMKRFCESQFGDKFQYIPKLDSDFYMSGLMIDWLDFLEKQLKFHDEKVLISDRYIYDVLAQAVHYNARINPLLALVSFFPVPDISFYLEIDPQLAHDRLRQRAFPTMHHLESLDNLKILEKAYRKVKEMVNWNQYIFHPTQDIDGMVDVILNKV